MPNRQKFPFLLNQRSVRRHFFDTLKPRTGLLSHGEPAQPTISPYTSPAAQAALDSSVSMCMARA